MLERHADAIDLGNPNYILAIDQGTTSTKALVLDMAGQVVSTSWPARFVVEPNYPQPGWVEFPPEQMLRGVLQSAQAAVRSAGLSLRDIAGLGLANQGETVIAFDAHTGRPVYPAISWQDRRGEACIRKWRRDGLEATIVGTTGLRLDAYFSAAKMAWIVENVPAARSLLAAGRLCLATSDAWLLWQLTGGRSYITDVSTASRTMLMDLATCAWNPHLTAACDIAAAALPEIVATTGSIGVTAQRSVGAEIPITALCVDQTAALFGQLALDAGQAKITYGTGCFVLANNGPESERRIPGIVTSVGWRLEDETTFVLDGGVYAAGSLVDWVCKLGLANDVVELAELARRADRGSNVLLVPALGGLAAPRWSGTARACWFGMDHNTDRRQLARSTLEAIAFRVKEICDAMNTAGLRFAAVHVDGGLSQCDVLMQIQADVLGLPLIRRANPEATATGIGYLAGLGCGVWKSVRELLRPPEPGEVIDPQPAMRDEYLARFAKWQQACATAVSLGDAGLFADGKCEHSA